MKHYTLIPNMISNKLISADTYRFTCLTFFPRKNGYTDTTINQLSRLVDESEHTTKDFIHRLKKAGVIKIQENNNPDKRRYKYFITEPLEDFKMIKKELLDLDIEISLKGFLIQLFTITFNNTLEVNLSINKIVKIIKISKPTAIKYIRQLVEMNLLKKTDTGFVLPVEYFKIGATKKEKDIKLIAEFIVGNEHLTKVYNSIKWDEITEPLKYWEKIVKDTQQVGQTIFLDI